MLKKHFRLAALQCNFQTREQTLSMPKFWHDNGFNTEQLLHTHADLYSAIYDPSKHKEIMTEYLKNSQQNGIDTIVYMNCHILGPSLKDHYDDWCVISKDGSHPKLYGTYPGACLNSKWKEYFFACIESLGVFKLEGLFFDGPVRMPCYCPACQAEFKKMFGKEMSEATEKEVWEFTDKSLLNFKKELYAKVKSVNPNWVMYFNEGLFAGHNTANRMLNNLKYNDLVGTEGGFFFYDPPKNLPYWHCATYAKMAEATAHGKPSVIFFAADHKPWGWFLHTSNELRLCYADAIGNGASVWLGLHSNPVNYNCKSGRDIMNMVKFDAANDRLYQNTKSIADTAVFYSFSTACLYKSSGESSDFYGESQGGTKDPGDYLASVHGAFAALEHLSMPYDIVTDMYPEEIMKYKVILAPCLAMLDDKTLESMRQFVKAGGILLADGTFGFYNENGAKRDPESFRDLVGASVTGKPYNMYTFNYMSLKWEGFESENAYDYQPAPEWIYKLDVKDNAETICMIPEPLEGCYSARPGVPSIPVATRNKLGKGMFCLFAGGLFEYYDSFQIEAIRRWFSSVFATVSHDFKLEKSIPGLSMTVRETENGSVLVHLTNHIGATRPLVDIQDINGAVLNTPAEWKTAKVLLGNGCAEKLADGKFQLPPLGDVTVLLLEK